MKKLIISLLFGLLIFPTVAFGEEVTTTSETENTKEKQKVEIVTTVSSQDTKLMVGGSTKLTADKILGVEPKVEFKEVKTDFIQLDKTGTLKALKMGTVKITPVFTLSADSLKEIKKVYLEQNKNVKEEDLNFVVKANEKEITYEIKEKEELIVDATRNYEVAPTEFKEGESGKVTPKPIEGVKLVGTFIPYKDAYIDFKADGTFKTLKVGKTEIKPNFKMSKETETAIKKAALKKANNKELTEENVTLANKDIQKKYPVTIKETASEKKVVDVELKFASNPSTLSVGQKGQLVVAPVYGVTPKGNFKAFKNEMIDIKTDGSFIVSKAGKMSILPNFTVSDESIKEIKEAYLKQEQDKKITFDNLDLNFKGTQSLISIEVVASSKNNGIKYVRDGSVKKLPQTGEKKGQIWLGLTAILVSFGLIYKKIK